MGGKNLGSERLSSSTDLSPDSADSYLTGHCIDGRVLYPATGYLVLAWRALVKSLGAVMAKTPVTFEDVTIHRATILPKSGEEAAVRWGLDIQEDVLLTCSFSFPQALCG